MLKIEQFVEQHFGIKLTPNQLELIALIASGEKDQLVQRGRFSGVTTAQKSALAYLQDGMKPIDTVFDTSKVDRFEVIDHRTCFWCRGRKTANLLQSDGKYKEMPCEKCDGSGIMGGRVYGAFSNPETSIIKVDLSYQDDGKTLKVFVGDRK